jgi:D-aspartate ligase
MLKSRNTITGVVIIEGHVQGLSNARSLGEAGVPVIVVDRNNCIARYSRYCKGFFLSPDFDSDDFALFLADLGERQGLNGWLLLPSNDHAVHTLSRNRGRLVGIYKLLTPETEIINRIYDKKNLLDLATGLGIKIPATRYFKSPGEAGTSELRYPVITRGRFGLSFYKSMKAKALLANNVEELGAQLSLIEELHDTASSLTQSVIPFTGSNRTVSFTAFCIDGEVKCYWTGQKLREHPWRFGTATLAESIESDECRDISARLLKGLNYTGVCEIEFIRDPEDGFYKLIEMNARTWLWVGLAKACGVNYALIAYRFVNGLDITFPDSYIAGVKWINWLTDSWFSLKALLTGKLRIPEYLKSLRGKKVRAVYSVTDPVPSAALIFMSLYIARKRG